MHFNKCNFIIELYRLNGRLLCYVRGFTQLPQKRKAATYFEGPGGHGRPLLAGSYVTQRVRLAYSKPGTSTGPVLCTFFRQKLTTLNQRKGENDRRKYFMINLHERMLPTSAGVEPATSWSPVGWRIQLSHRGRL